MRRCLTYVQFDYYTRDLCIFLLNVNALTCITNLSSWDPKMRMTPQEAMQHKWILEGRRYNHHRTHDHLRHEPKDSTAEPPVPNPRSGPLRKGGHKAFCEERLAHLRNVCNPMKISILKPSVKHLPWSGDIHPGLEVRKHYNKHIYNALWCTVLHPKHPKNHIRSLSSPTSSVQHPPGWPCPPSSNYSFQGRIMISWLLMIGWCYTICWSIWHARTSTTASL